MTTPNPGQDLERTQGNYRDDRGRFVGSEQARKRRQEAARLRLTGMSYARIAAAVGYADETTACRAVKMELRDASRENIEELRELQAQRLDAYTEVLVNVLRANHVMVSVTRGQIIIDPSTMEPLRDFGPVVDAVRELRQLNESQRRLFGVDPKQPAEVHVTVTEVSQADVEFREMVAEEKARRAAAKATAVAE